MTIQDLEITGKIICNGNNAGAISAWKIRKINNCISRVNIEATGDYIGGLCGGLYYGNGIITNSINYGNIEGKNYVGGIMAARLKASDSKNYGNVKGNIDVGGISGGESGITRCYNYSNIEGNKEIGGIQGIVAISQMNQGANYGNIKGNKNIGGIVGTYEKEITIANFLNCGNVEGSENVGGISGYNTSMENLINCANYKSIKGENFVGGICGKIEYNTREESGKIINSYSVGNTVSTGTMGAIVGAKSGYGVHRIEKCYWLTTANLQCVGIVTTNSKMEIEDEESFDSEYMQSQKFLDLLNKNVKEYNENNNSGSNFIKLCEWKFNKDNKYPEIEF